MKPDRLDRLMTVGPAAKWVGVGPRQIRRALARGELASYQVGGWTRLRLGDVVDWLEQRRRPAGAPALGAAHAKDGGGE